MSGPKGKQINNKGAAMILVLCIMMVFLALSLSILLAASVMQGTARKAAVSERCKVAAFSYSELVERQLVVGAEVISSMEADSVKSLFRTFIVDRGAAGVYDPEETADVPEKITLACGMEGESIGQTLNGYNIQMQVYWEGDGKEIENALNAAGSDPLEIEKAYRDIRLYVDVICVKASESYRVRSEYAVTVVGGVNGNPEWGFTLGGRY